MSGAFGTNGSILDSEGCEAEFCLARHHFAATKVDAARGHIQLCLHCKARVHNTCQICPSGEKTEVACSSHCFEQLLAEGLTLENGSEDLFKAQVQNIAQHKSSSNSA